MKKGCILGLTILLFAGSLSCSFRRSEPITGKVVPADNLELRTGQVLYMAHCYRCHPGGEGGLGPALNSLHVPSFVKKFQIRHGLGTMPGFNKNEIEEGDLKYITKYMHYLHELKPGS